MAFKLEKREWQIHRHVLTFATKPGIWSFHVVVLQHTAKKCTKTYNVGAERLFCSLNQLFCGVLVAVADVRIWLVNVQFVSILIGI